MSSIRNLWLGPLASLIAMTAVSLPAYSQQQKPNIVVIMGDDMAGRKRKPAWPSSTTISVW
jgi:hypothetical protein